MSDETRLIELSPSHLRTLQEIVDQGSFESAARALHISPSAVSQRLNAMEKQIGTVLVIRSKPVSLTEMGEVALKSARQLTLLLAEANRELTRLAALKLPIALNGDSLTTWALPALAEFTHKHDTQFDIRRADESHAIELLARGDVALAITTQRAPLNGCEVTPLVVHRYYPVATPEFVSRWFPDGVTAAAFAKAPVIDFDQDDPFQKRFLRRYARGKLDPPRHCVPASHDFLRAIGLGMGWGMAPLVQSAELIQRGELVQLVPDKYIDVPLYIQRWNIRSNLLDILVRALTDAAARAVDGLPRLR